MEPSTVCELGETLSADCPVRKNLVLQFPRPAFERTNRRVGSSRMPCRAWAGLIPLQLVAAPFLFPFLFHPLLLRGEPCRSQMTGAEGLRRIPGFGQ
ncbi:hypothetical protein HRbin30_02417 [bacterium HR30]|nr:hypothetical protein HRbin30_02417 [bacterium HR30]